MSDELLFEVSGGVAVMTINRPDRRNAINRAVAEGISAAVDEMDRRSDVVVGILTGAGGTFCAGMDLRAFTRGESVHVEGKGFGGIVEAPPRKPLIAAVEGHAVAGGCELALSADVVVAARTARFGLPEVKRGLVAVAGGLLRLPKSLPYQVAMRMILTGDPITAEEAHRFGLVVELAEEGGALETAHRLAARIAANGPMAVRLSKQVAREAIGWTDAEAWARQKEALRPVATSYDAMEGAKAFIEKREPVWRGE